MSGLVACKLCGRPVRMVLVVPSRLTRLAPGERRRYIPLDPTFDPAGGVPPSHGMNLGRTVCHPITADSPLLDEEKPALTHFATCPARASALPSLARTEGPRP